MISPPTRIKLVRTIAIAALLACGLALSLSAAEASVEWKVKLEGRVISADSRVIKILTPQNEVINLVRHSVPQGFDLRPGKVIRWIAPEFKERKPSGDSSSPKYPK